MRPQKFTMPLTLTQGEVLLDERHTPLRGHLAIGPATLRARGYDEAVNKPVEKVIEDALSLSQTDRERLVGELLTSLGPHDGDVEVDATVAAELQRRIDALRDGTVKPSAVDDVFARLEARFTKKPS